MKFLHDVVVVRVMEQYISPGGIHILEPVRATNIQPGLVIAVGSKCRYRLYEIAVGDIVYVNLYLGTERLIDGLTVRIYDSEDIVAKRVGKE